MTRAPRFMMMRGSSSAFSGTTLGTANDIRIAGTRKLTALGRNSSRNVAKSTTPRCQTISVVMSPNGLKAPPALAATTILMQAMPIKRGLPRRWRARPRT